MNSLILDIAAEVIGKASRAQPADATLRDELRGKRDLSPAERRDVTRAVFTYYRWHGWLENEKALTARISRALELAERFRKNPSSLPVDALRSKAVPAWAAEEVQISDEWLQSLQCEPMLWLRARPGRGRELATKLRLARTLGLPEAVLYEGREDLFRTPEFAAGEFEIQDLSSQAVGLICNPKPGETWWDACAGEGGKTMHLSDLMQNKGLIWASDRSLRRLAKLKERAARAKVFNFRAAPWEGGAKPPTRTKFDGILIDAPCSGVGTWQRNPHARWTTQPADVHELAAVQANLLDHVAGSLKPGGRLVYAVCTLTRAETTGVAAAFTAAHPELTPDAVRVAGLGEPGPGSATPATRFLWPQDLNANGMFIAAWKKR